MIQDFDRGTTNWEPDGHYHNKVDTSCTPTFFTESDSTNEPHVNMVDGMKNPILLFEEQLLTQGEENKIYLSGELEVSIFARTFERWLVVR